MAGPTMRAALVLPNVGVRRDFERALGALLPSVQLEVMDPIAAGTGAEALREVEALFTFGAFISNEALQGAERLRWIQGLGAGIDGLVDRSGLDPGVWVTSARGVHGPCVSEAAFAMMLAMSRDFPKLFRAQQAHQWATGPAQLLAGRTVGVVGVGVIAEALAKRCKAFDMRVEGLSSRTSAPFFDRLRPYDDLVAAVADVDYLVLLTPLTETTAGLIDARVLAALKPDAFLINVSRGGVVDEAAMIRALTSGRLRGAALDVYAVEPLPKDSPLWDMPNVLISPHSAGQHRDYAQDVAPIVATNLAALREGRFSDLVNVVRAARAPPAPIGPLHGQ